MELDSTQDLRLARLAVERGHVTWRQLTELIVPGNDRQDLDSLLRSSGLIPPSLLAQISAEAHTHTRGSGDTAEGRTDDLPELAPGARFALPGGAQLEIERTLGRGGMGVVYLVRDPRLDRHAALKLSRCESDARRRARFRREAVVTAQLDHPQIPPVYEAGQADSGEDYLLLRYVRGKSLGELLERHTRKRSRASFAAPEVPRELLRALVSVARAVAYANARGIVHRDLKPDNVMLGDFGEVLVLDWGLARDLREGAVPEESATLCAEGPAFDARLTHDRAILGTLPYMSPEQANREAVDARSDVFSLGAVLCEVLCGAPPFALSGSFWSVLARVCDAQVRLPSARSADVPPELEAIAAKALAADPDERYATASELADDLEAYLEGRPVAAYHYRVRDRLRRALRSNPSFGTALALSLAAMFAVGLLFKWQWSKQIADARARSQAAWRELQSGPRADLEERLGRALTALRAARRWDRRAEGAAAARLARFRAACALGEIALGAHQWSLARQAYGEASALGVDDALARESLDRVRAASEAEEERRFVLVRDLLEQVAQSKLTWKGDLPASLRLGLTRGPRVQALLSQRLGEVTAELLRVRRETLLAVADPNEAERAAGETRLEGLALALSEVERCGLRTQPDASTQATFAAACARLEARALRAGRTETWVATVARSQEASLRPGLLALASVACEALGDLGPREAVVPPLARYLDAEASPQRAVLAGVALCKQRERRTASAALKRFGPQSAYATAMRAFAPR